MAGAGGSAPTLDSCATRRTVAPARGAAEVLAVIDAEQLLKRMFQAALDAARPERVLAPHLPPPPKGRTIVVGAGKAAASMAAAVEANWPGPLSGLVVTRYGHTAPVRHISVVEAAH